MDTASGEYGYLTAPMVGSSSMGALALPCLIFVLTLGGILLGAVLRRALPKHHLDKEA